MSKQVVLTEDSLTDLLEDAFIEGYKAAGEIIRISADMRANADVMERLKKSAMQ